MKKSIVTNAITAGKAARSAMGREKYTVSTLDPQVSIQAWKNAQIVMIMDLVAAMLKAVAAANEDAKNAMGADFIIGTSPCPKIHGSFRRMKLLGPHRDI